MNEAHLIDPLTIDDPLPVEAIEYVRQEYDKLISSAELRLKVAQGVLRVLAAVSLIGVVAILIVLYNELMDKVTVDIWGAIAVGVVGITWCAVYVVSRRIQESVREDRFRRNYHLADLDSCDGKRCVEYLALCEQFPELSAYQGQIAAMNRMPIGLDYYVVKEWCSDITKRQDRDRAAMKTRAARERLTNWNSVLGQVPVFWRSGFSTDSHGSRSSIGTQRNTEWPR